MRRYRNHEGYSDPTAGQAMEHITREERSKRKALIRGLDTEPEDKPKPPRYVNQPKVRRRK